MKTAACLVLIACFASLYAIWRNAEDYARTHNTALANQQQVTRNALSATQEAVTTIQHLRAQHRADSLIIQGYRMAHSLRVDKQPVVVLN